MDRACGTQKRNVYKLWPRDTKRRDQIGDIGIDEKVILKGILNKKGVSS